MNRAESTFKARTLDPEQLRKPWVLHLAGGDSIKMGKGDLYFVGHEGGPVKIGWSCNPKKRMRDLQTATPYKLELLAVLPDGGYLEAEYHERFASSRLHGEWFERTPELLAEITRLCEVKA